MGEERSRLAIAAEGEGRSGPKRLRFRQATKVLGVVEVAASIVEAPDASPGVSSSGGEVSEEEGETGFRERYCDRSRFFDAEPTTKGFNEGFRKERLTGRAGPETVGAGIVIVETVTEAQVDA